MLHLVVVGVDDGRGEFNQGVLLRAAPDRVVVTDLDKVLAGQARNTERFYCWKYALKAIRKWLLLYFLVHDNCQLFML